MCAHDTYSEGEFEYMPMPLTFTVKLGHAMQKRVQAYADSEGPDQPAHPRSLIRAFGVRQQNHWILQNI